MKYLFVLLLLINLSFPGYTESGQLARFEFEGNLNNEKGTLIKGIPGGKTSYVKGLDGQALRIKSAGTSGFLQFIGNTLKCEKRINFSVQCWVKTTQKSDKPFVVLSQKEYIDTSIESQKKPGWVLYISGGTWAWNMGSGTRRITYQRENGKHMPMNDGRWHQLTMTYNSSKSEVRLFYDGENKAIYKVDDVKSFDFSNDSRIIAGSKRISSYSPGAMLPQIRQGAQKLQMLVDEFNRLGLKKLEPEQLEDLIVNPQRLFDRKVKEMKIRKGEDTKSFLQLMKSVDLDLVKKLRADLMKNAYTVHQVKDFMKVAPLLKIYSLVGNQIVINQNAAMSYTKKEQLYQPDFALDNLTIWDRVLSHKEVLDSYAKYVKSSLADVEQKRDSITAAVWNIHHGGIHYTTEKDGWDSRLRITEMLKKEEADVIMMQETYSNGDFIAAELGYYFATTIDWDYLNQGANISVLSRYPIKEIYVPKNASFNNVAVKIAISKTQEIYVMSNWYGMKSFPAVFDFHKTRFANSDTIPTLFAGDFNAVPHTDGGNSPASGKLLERGFTDAFRSLHPDVNKFPGISHRSGNRIDQLYYKGKGLINTSTRTISTWPDGFPSDHYLIISKFKLCY